MNKKPEVTRRGILDMQVCVPADWDDGNVEQFANAENEAGTMTGWHVRKDGSKLLAGKPERNPCADREGFVHIMLDC